MAILRKLLHEGKVPTSEKAVFVITVNCHFSIFNFQLSITQLTTALINLHILRIISSWDLAIIINNVLGVEFFY